MTKPLPTDHFERPSSAMQVRAVDGLPAAIDDVAAVAAPTHRFLRHGWFAAALVAYGGRARTLVASLGEVPQVALPLVRRGPAVLGLAAVPGSYWPFRGVPARVDAPEEAYRTLLSALAREVRVLRWGPVYDDDPVLSQLLVAARAAGWVAIDRWVARSFRLDMAALAADGGWPRGSTLRKNRFHEKHLAAHGALDWQFVSGPDWSEDLFAALAGVEERSWIAARTDGQDAKFTKAGHGAFWQAAARDPALAAMTQAAVLRIDGQAMAFSFDLDAGTLKYAIANSYDPAVGKHSPGKLLYYRNLVRSLGRGIEAVDWGAGDGGYKTTIGAVPGPAIRDWLLVRPGLSAAVARLLADRWRRSGHAEE